MNPLAPTAATLMANASLRVVINYDLAGSLDQYISRFVDGLLVDLRGSRAALDVVVSVALVLRIKADSCIHSCPIHRVCRSD